MSVLEPVAHAALCFNQYAVQQSLCCVFQGGNSMLGAECEGHRKGKGRTGWPQHVWALELKQEQL